MKLKLLFSSLFFCLSIVAFGQAKKTYTQIADTSYSALWQQADSLFTKEYTQQGNETVKQIETLARADKNYQQLIKALLVQLSIDKKLKETNLWKQLQQLDAEVANIPAPHKNVLQSMLGSAWLEIAETRSYYYEDEIEPDTTDPTTWPINQILKKAEDYFLASVSNDGLLKETGLKNYGAIIDMPQNSERYQPMLYDVLMWRFYSFYKVAIEKEETYKTDTLSLPTEMLLADKATFVTLSWQSNLPESYNVKALRILQTLIKHYQNTLFTDALVMADIERINFATTYYQIPNADSLQLAWLEAQISIYSNHRIVAELYFRAAQMLSCINYWWSSQVCNNPKALRYCKTAIANFPDEQGTQWCRDIAQQIEKATVQITTEFTTPAKAPFKYLISYKNSKKIYVKYIAITDESLKNVENFKPYSTNDSNQHIRLKKLLTYPIKGEDEITLPDDSTYLNFTTEWYCKGLPAGHYILLFSADKNFIADTTITGYVPFWSTKYTTYTTPTSGKNYRFFVADMQTNAPLKGAKVILSYYDYYTGSGNKKIIAEKTTDKNGSIEVLADESYWSVNTEVFIGDKKVLASNNSTYLNDYEFSGHNNDVKTHFVTDRGIYRPGQTVYFKGTMLRSYAGDSMKVVVNYPTTIILDDANGEKVGEVAVTSNKYGSFSGSFTIPYARITGYYTLHDKYGSAGFSVEEYKRPKFKIEFDTLKTNPAFNDTVTITGRAVAYAGNALDGARFEYTVSREEEYIYNGWKINYPSGHRTLLYQGSSALDQEGRFTIKFVTTPGSEQSHNYNYETEITVTDITGEVQSKTTSVKSGKRTVYAALAANETAFTDEPSPLRIAATDLNENSIPLKGTLKITEIILNEKIQKELFWNKPSVVILPQNIQHKYFSNQYYFGQLPDENLGKTVFSQNIDSANGICNLLFNAANIPQGKYQIAFEYIDNLGDTQQETSVFTVYNLKEKKAIAGSQLEVIARELLYEPGQTAEVIISSQAPKTRVLYFIERIGQTAALQQVKLNNNRYTLKIPITEADRGGVNIVAITVYNNRMYQSSVALIVPHQNKDLTVEVTTYRDKMIPGDKEEWQLKITGPNAQKISAEVVASMYDASLDNFAPNSWYNYFVGYQKWLRTYVSPQSLSTGEKNSSFLLSLPYTSYYTVPLEYNSFRFFKWIDDPLSIYSFSFNPYQGLYNSGGGLGSLGSSGFGSGGGGAAEGGGGIMGRVYKAQSSENNMAMRETLAVNSMAFAPPQKAENGIMTGDNADNLTKLPPVPFMKVRRNLDETAFFFPHLQTDDSGAVIVKFIAPEALTQWNFRAFAHTADLKSGMVSLSAITQKPLMVQTNMPRFLREGDEIYINAKVVNLSNGELNPNVVLEVYDAATGKNIKEFSNLNIVQVPQMAAGVSQSVKWKFTVPKGYGALKMIIKAYDGQFTDAEANTIPILSDEVLVTEALPITFSGSQPKTYELKKLTQSGQNTTLKNHKLTVEYTANPAWYAIQALPYMAEYPHECAEQLFNRFYANTLAYYIVESSPAIRDVLVSWKLAAEQGNGESFLSNLEKNPELKALLLEETPWMAEGKDESARKQKLLMLFDDNTMQANIDAAINKLAAMRNQNGSYPWFAGMQPNLAITQYIVAGTGKLKAAGDRALNLERLEVQASLLYMHKEAQKRYNEIKNANRDIKTNTLTFATVQYLYAISYFDEQVDTERSDYEVSVEFWKKQAAKYWPGRSRMEQAMIALALFRLGDDATAKTIVEALRQNAITNADNGMYWKEMTGGYGWTDAPVESEAVLIEAFSEITHDTNSINKMRQWLLKQKQLTDWKTTRATADACYALLLNGTDWLQTTPSTTVTVGKNTINPATDPEIKTEAGTGYIKKSYSGEAITPDMGKVTITPQNNQNVPMTWGGLYWQYFEKLNNITRAQTPLSLIKQLFIEKTTDSGVVKTQLKPGDVLKTGDKITVRIYLKANNDMEFVYLKDMRAAAFEPTDFLSGSRWQNGVSYYQSIRDASMNFFFDRLPKGQWMFEYEVKVSQAGTFQNGIATVQSMYAPEYTSHSESIVVEVKP
jgi:uncharacterized protein YfaS (alpha-2-macroglobulin family)